MVRAARTDISRAAQWKSNKLYPAKSLVQLSPDWEQKNRGGVGNLMAKLKPGDRVSWNTSQGKTTGKVVKRTTAKSRINGHTVAASKANPEYIVKSSKSGKTAAHKRKALKKA